MIIMINPLVYFLMQIVYYCCLIKKKELNAKEIYDMFKYENGKKYILNDLDNYDDISEDNQYYLNECHKIFKNIIDGLEIPEE